jgi:hypothetical protein
VTFFGQPTFKVRELRSHLWEGAVKVIGWKEGRSGALFGKQNLL